MAKKETLLATGEYVTYSDLIKQRANVSTSALIRYNGELHSQAEFLRQYGGGMWIYKAADLQLFDPASTANYDVKPTHK